MRRDSQYTDPETLRLLYQNPLNPLGGLADQNPLPPPAAPPVPPVPQHGPSYCPAVGQWTIKYFSSKRERWTYALVENLRPRVDRLWNPIIKDFDLVEEAEIVDNVPVLRVTTTNRCEQIVSWPHPVIQSFEDKDGTAAEILRERIKTQEQRAISCVGADAIETGILRIGEIRGVPSMSVVKIHLREWHLFASGSVAGRLIVGHNKQTAGGGDGPPEPIEPPL